MIFKLDSIKRLTSYYSIAVVCLLVLYTFSYGIAVAAPPSHDGNSISPAKNANKPLLIKEQGSFFVAGEPIFTETGNDTNIEGSRNPGTATINQTYVEYQIPLKRKVKHPVIMMPGGGHEQKIYETTPDGREGWSTYFVRQGLPVYLSDGVNRGASSYDITNIVLVSQGMEPPSAIPAMNRYTYEAAWVNFRLGPEFEVPFPGSQFPFESFEQYTAQLVPAFRDPVEDEKNVRALIALIDKIGPAVLLTWSQSGRFGFKAAAQRPDLVKAIVSIEPAAISEDGTMALLTPEDLEVLAGIPSFIVLGDFRDDIEEFELFAQSIGDNVEVLVLPEIGITGNSHVMMLEKNNLQIADILIDWIDQNVGKHHDKGHGKGHGKNHGKHHGKDFGQFFKKYLGFLKSKFQR